jgi:hypothetical protein
MRLVQVKRLDRGTDSTELAEVSPSCPFGRGLIASGYLYVPLNRNGSPSRFPRPILQNGEMHSAFRDLAGLAPKSPAVAGRFRSSGCIFLRNMPG